jgi:glyoxylase I family protein
MHLHHLAFRTSHLGALADFYVRVLGFVRLPLHPGSEGSSAGERVWLRAGDALIMLEQRAVGEPSFEAGSKELVAFRVTPAERKHLHTQLEREAIAVEETTAYTTYVRDPDGRRIGLSHFPEPAP